MKKSRQFLEEERRSDPSRRKHQHPTQDSLATFPDPPGDDAHYLLGWLLDDELNALLKELAKQAGFRQHDLIDGRQALRRRILSKNIFACWVTNEELATSPSTQPTVPMVQPTQAVQSDRRAIAISYTAIKRSFKARRLTQVQFDLLQSLLGTATWYKSAFKKSDWDQQMIIWSSSRINVEEVLSQA